METLRPPRFLERSVMELSKALSDPFGRRFSYLRLSLTEVCNFRCTYCLPNGYHKCGEESTLSTAEIQRLIQAVAALGIWKVRLTGGEPTLRTDFLDIAERIAATAGIRKLALTTNGYKLPERAFSYRASGIDSINISIDSFNPSGFEKITGHNRFREVLEGVDACLSAGFSNVKINTVLLKNVNDGELEEFVAFVKNKPVSLRFIELMQTLDNADYFKSYHLSGAHVAEYLIDKGWVLTDRPEGAGPAQEYAHPDYTGKVGIISPYSKDFCKTCNRIRVSSTGNLHLCLFGEGGYSLKSLLQEDSQGEELCEKIMDLMGLKRDAHRLHEGCAGATRHLASIGG